MTERVINCGIIKILLDGKCGEDDDDEKGQNGNYFTWLAISDVRERHICSL